MRGVEADDVGAARTRLFSVLMHHALRALYGSNIAWTKPFIVKLYTKSGKCVLLWRENNDSE